MHWRNVWILAKIKTCFTPGCTSLRLKKKEKSEESAGNSSLATSAQFANECPPILCFQNKATKFRSNANDCCALKHFTVFSAKTLCVKKAHRKLLYILLISAFCIILICQTRHVKKAHKKFHFFHEF